MPAPSGHRILLTENSRRCHARRRPRRRAVLAPDPANAPHRACERTRSSRTDRSPQPPADGTTSPGRQTLDARGKLETRHITGLMRRTSGDQHAESPPTCTTGSPPAVHHLRALERHPSQLPLPSRRLPHLVLSVISDVTNRWILTSPQIRRCLYRRILTSQSWLRVVSPATPGFSGRRPRSLARSDRNRAQPASGLPAGYATTTRRGSRRGRLRSRTRQRRH